MQDQLRGKLILGFGSALFAYLTLWLFVTVRAAAAGCCAKLCSLRAGWARPA
jgi:hypothetical protein